LSVKLFVLIVIILPPAAPVFPRVTYSENGHMWWFYVISGCMHLWRSDVHEPLQVRGYTYVV